MYQSHKPRTHHLARDIHNYNQYEAPVKTQEVIPSSPSEYQASQSGNILQPVTYSPPSSQVSTTNYQDLRSGNETSMRQEFEPKHSPPPKPPKVPQEPLDDVQRITQFAAQQIMYPTQRTPHHYDSSINQDQHHYQSIAEQSQQRSEPTSRHPAASVASNEQQRQTPIPNRFQSQGHWNHSSLSDEIYLNSSTQQVVSTLVSPLATKNPSGGHVDSDDIHRSLPSFQDETKSSATVTPENIPSHLHQQNSSGHSYSLQADLSPQPFLSSVNVSDGPSGPQSAKESTVEPDILKPGERKSELRQENSFYWHKESRPSSALSDITNDALELRDPENNGIHYSRVLENKSTDDRPASEFHNASALGLGGPSDWEHFGDYKAQEVDDTDLYNSDRFRAASTTVIDSAELPAENISTENQHQLGESQLFKLPDPTSSPNTGLLPPPETTHQMSQDNTVAVESRLNKALELKSLPPLIKPSSAQHITIDSSGVMDIIALKSPQETDLNDAIQLWPENRASQTRQDSAASHLKPSSGKTSDFISISGNVTNDPASITNTISGSAKESSVNEYAQVLRPPELTSLNDKIISLRNDSITLSYDSSAVQQKPKADVDTVGINMAHLPLGSEASIQPLRSTNMTVDRTDVGQHGPIGLPNTNKDVVEATFIDKKLELHDAVADNNSNLTVFTQIVGSQTAYAELTPNSLSLSRDLTENMWRRDVNQDVSNGFTNQISPLEAKKNPDPLTRSDGTQVPAKHRNKVSLQATSNEQQTGDDGSESEAARIVNLEYLEATKSSGVESSGVVHEAASKDDSNIDDHVKKASYNVTGSAAFTAAATLHINGPENYYGNLDAWGRASLSRYLSMLREEAGAKTDKEKLTIFMVFARRETRLRAVLYGLEDETAPVENRDSQKHPARALTQRSQKALPALPLVGDPSKPPTIHHAPVESLISQGDIKISDPEEERSVKVGTSPTSESPTDEMQYSPGGRPIVSRGQHHEAKPQKLAVELTLREKVSKVFTQVSGYTNSTSSPSLNSPTLASSEVLGSQKPSYVPFKYENHAGPAEYVLDRRLTPTPYVALASVPPDKKSTIAKTFDGDEGIKVAAAIHDKNNQPQNVIKANEDVISSLENTEENGQTGVPDLRRFVKADFDPLVAVLPISETVPVDSLQLQELNDAIDAFPDDFSFIHQSVVAWDAISKKERAIHERERHLRQGESERKIDALFDDNEIGYGDISELESEFKNSEAAKKADEDWGEYQTFLSSVFDAVWERLHYEIAQLTPLSTKCLQLVNDSLVGKDMFEASPEKSILAPTMGLLLALHQKLEIRHQKAFEAVLERDRRLKKTEISPWYTLGNVAKVKQLEKQFDNAEKKAILEFCEQRRDRANKLMDVLDTNQLRGVGANQDYMEAIMKSIRRIASGRAFASIPSSEAGLGVEEVNKAKLITTILTSLSEQIVQTCHVAEMLLNAADYEVSVANAKLGNTGADTLVRLREEKSKEDQKLMENLEHRLALIREDSKKTQDEIEKLFLFLGVQNGHALSPIKAAFPAPGHEDRIQKALETAKRRNAVKAPR